MNEAYAAVYKNDSKEKILGIVDELLEYGNTHFKTEEKYFDEFKSLSESTSLSNLLPKEYTGREDTMILNAAFLVSKDKVLDFKWAFDTLRNKDENSGFIIEATGPWPPFSFISIKEKQ